MMEPCPFFRAFAGHYRLRSAIVHGEQVTVDERTSEMVEFQIVRWAVEPTLEWLSQQPNDPMAQIPAHLRKRPPEI
jgi:hypothetical protein